MSSVSNYVYDSAQRRSPAINELREVLRYRDLLIQLVRRDVLTRYKRSVLGIAWTMLNPLGTMLVLTIAFSQILGKDQPGFPAYLLSGLIAWIFFSQTTNAAMVHLIWGEGLLKRIYIPRTIFALSAVGVGLVNLLFSIIPLLVVMLLVRVPIRPTLLFLPVAIFFLVCFALGVGLVLSTLAVYFADVAEMYQVAITAWMYLSPVIYPADILDPQVRFWVSLLNPMYHLIIYFRTPIYEGVIPSLEQTLITGGISLGTLLLGWLFFTSKSDEFAYRI
jgi:ABC-2 type transport system permease protein